MREVVHRVDAPGVARAMVMSMADAVQHRIAHHDVGRSHVDLGAQDEFAILVLAGAHVAEQRKVLVHRAVAERRRRARASEVATVGGNLLSALAVDVGGAALDQHFGKAVELFEIVAGVVQVRAGAVFPRVAEPVHRVDDGVDVFGVFLDGVGVVKAQVAAALVVLGQAEVHPDALGVTDVQVTVGLRRKARDDRRKGLALGVLAAGIGALRQVAINDLAQEVGRGGGGRPIGVVLAHGNA